MNLILTIWIKIWNKTKTITRSNLTSNMIIKLESGNGLHL